MAHLQIEAVRRALMLDSACGDQYAYWHDGDCWMLCLVDGLGHGLPAEQAALAAIDYVGAHRGQDLSAIFAGCDKALRGTRGVAMSLMQLRAGSLVYAAIGNTQARICRTATGKCERLLGNYGIVGGGYRRLQPQRATLVAQDLLILHSDGISDKFDIPAYDASLRGDPARLAARLLTDWGKALDDAAVMVARYEPEP